MDARQLKIWREKQEITQEDLGEWLGLSGRSVANYEKVDEDGGKIEYVPRIFELACLAVHLGIARFDGKSVFRDDDKSKLPGKAKKRLDKLVYKTTLLLESLEEDKEVKAKDRK